MKRLGKERYQGGRDGGGQQEEIQTWGEHTSSDKFTAVGTFGDKDIQY